MLCNMSISEDSIRFHKGLKDQTSGFAGFPPLSVRPNPKLELNRRKEKKSIGFSKMTDHMSISTQ